MTPDADSIVVKVARKSCRNSTEKAHRPRAFPSTAGLSGNYQLLDNALSVFDELALHSRPMVFDEEIAKVVCLGFIKEETACECRDRLTASCWASAATDHEGTQTHGRNPKVGSCILPPGTA